MKAFTKDSDYRNIKIRLNSKDEFAHLQLLLFKHGCFWGSAKATSTKTKGQIVVTDRNPDAVYVNMDGRIWDTAMFGGVLGETDHFLLSQKNEAKLISTYSLTPVPGLVEIDGMRYEKETLKKLIREHGDQFCIPVDPTWNDVDINSEYRDIKIKVFCPSEFKAICEILLNDHACYWKDAEDDFGVPGFRNPENDDAYPVYLFVGAQGDIRLTFENHPSFSKDRKREMQLSKEYDLEFVDDETIELYGMKYKKSQVSGLARRYLDPVK